jgi:hypothetical protein
LKKSAAEEVLDWLENQGDLAATISYAPAVGFAVSVGNGAESQTS